MEYSGLPEALMTLEEALRQSNENVSELKTNLEFVLAREDRLQHAHDLL
jgi:hypothetical protein